MPELSDLVKVSFTTMNLTVPIFESTTDISEETETTALTGGFISNNTDTDDDNDGVLDAD